jgi:hypothetical protein
MTSSTDHHNQKQRVRLNYYADVSCHFVAGCVPGAITRQYVSQQQQIIDRHWPLTAFALIPHIFSCNRSGLANSRVPVLGVQLSSQ